MELRHLRYFVSVAEEGHFGRAARRLHMSQPPLSQQIRRLEEEVGAPLLARTHHGVELTTAGEALLPEARRTLEQADHAMAVARRGEATATAPVELGFVSSASYLLADLLPVVRRLVPHLALSVREGSTSQQAEMLRDGTLTAGLLRPPVVGAGIATQTVTREPLLVALPEEHPLAHRPALALADLAHEPFVLFERHLGHALFDQITTACRDAGFVPDVVHASGSMVTITHLVAGGVGASIVPASVARDVHGVRFRAADGLDQHVSLDVAWREDAPPAELVAAIAEATRLTVEWSVPLAA